VVWSRGGGPEWFLVVGGEEGTKSVRGVGGGRMLGGGHVLGFGAGTGESEGGKH